MDMKEIPSASLFAYRRHDQQHNELLRQEITVIMLILRAKFSSQFTLFRSYDCIDYVTDNKEKLINFLCTTQQMQSEDHSPPCGG
ncbi:CLUMA_CG013031, isoform A [Clunio marinus]|uniref:CLUMA_CG013031, isoform A n=1 Tax=Clunio marinus TaxID=568069 RepID=A0A1J1IHM9_9DIPT|nr:CLUMA_CG013031, isoform A [Clunio marinus]